MTLTEELEELAALAPLGLLVWLLVLGALVWLLAVGLPLALRIAWQLGLDPRRRLRLVSNVARLLAPATALLGVFAPLWGRAPGLSLLGLAALVTLAVAASPSSAHNLAAGINLAFRARPRPGDLIRIGELEGRVEEIGLMRVSLRAREGGVTLVPAADFDRLSVTIGSQAAAVPVEVEFQSPEPLDEAALQRMRRALWCSPFRRAGSAIRLSGDLPGGRVRAALDAWAPLASTELETHVRELLRRAAAPPEARAPLVVGELGAGAEAAYTGAGEEEGG